MNFKKKLKPKQKIYIFFLSFIAFVVLTIYFIILPSLKKIKKTRESILNQKIELKKTIDQSKNINQLKEKINRIEPGLKKMDKIFINKNRELDFITSLESIADKYNVKQDINLNPGKNKNEPYEIAPISIKLKGSYLNTLQYLREIENVPYYINIKTINFNSSLASNNNSQIKSEEEINVNMIIEANIYWKNN